MILSHFPEKNLLFSGQIFEQVIGEQEKKKDTDMKLSHLPSKDEVDLLDCSAVSLL